jgi:predicted Rossmann fold flavoprotein
MTAGHQPVYTDGFMRQKDRIHAADGHLHYDVIVIGGGASGMMAACAAGRQGKRTLLLEKNRRVGEKLRISGGGRCNITNAEPEVRKLLKRYGTSEQLLYSAFSQFGVPDTFAFFEDRQLPLVVEASQRAFPVTEKALDVVRVLEESLKKEKVEVKTAAPVSHIEMQLGRVISVAAGDISYTARSFILATGGLSHPETGSTGDGFSWLKKWGHSITMPSPTIVPLATKESWAHALQGSSLTAKITFLVNGKKAFVEKGPILFTHFGISGPTILNASSRVADLLQEGSVTARIDCFPELDDAGAESRVLAVFDAEKNKMLKNVFTRIVPGMHTALLAALPSISPDAKVHSITKEERKALCQFLKAMPLTITGLMGFDRAVVADGGVPLTEIDMRTMRSQVVSNLFVTGDLLHIRRPSGGYSLQLCWTTGFIAGTHA